MSGVAAFVLDTIDALSLLVGAGKWRQALVVLYSAIDTLAWSTLVDGDVTRSDFCAWVNSYMDPPATVQCTAEDLYAARCGLLHSSSAGSRLSREGKAAELWYATSADRVPVLRRLAHEKGHSAKIVGITPLVEAFADGARRFVETLAADRALDARVNARVALWLGFVRSTPPGLTREGGGA